MKPKYLPQALEFSIFVFFSLLTEWTLLLNLRCVQWNSVTKIISFIYYILGNRKHFTWKSLNVFLSSCSFFKSIICIWVNGICLVDNSCIGPHSSEWNFRFRSSLVQYSERQLMLAWNLKLLVQMRAETVKYDHKSTDINPNDIIWMITNNYLLHHYFFFKWNEFILFSMSNENESPVNGSVEIFAFSFILWMDTLFSMRNSHMPSPLWETDHRWDDISKLLNLLKYFKCSKQSKLQIICNAMEFWWIIEN